MAARPVLAARPPRPEGLVTPFVSGDSRRAAFEPALTLSDAAVAWLNDAGRRRAAWRARLGDRSVTVQVERICWEDEPAAAEMLDFVWETDGERVVLSLPRLIAQTLLSTVQAGLDLPSEPSRSLALELALEPLLVEFETRARRSPRLVAASAASAAGPHFKLDIAYGQLQGQGRLFLFSPLDGPATPFFQALGAMLAELPIQKRELPADFPLVAAGEIGSLRIPAKLLRSARPGDVLLPEDAPLARGQLVLAVGDRLWASADLAGDRLLLRGRFRPRPNPLEHTHMTAPTEPAQPPPDASLDDVEVTLVFECGRWPITIGALRSIGEGHIFELGRPVDGPVDILVNGRRIGRGDIVRVGDTLGVRLHGGLVGDG